jgi:hypothetical protein
MDPVLFLRSAVILFFMAWLLLTVLTQFKGSLRYKIKTYDVFSLIPIWTFFAPRPTTCDLCLKVRDIYPSGELGPWRTVETNPPRRIFHILWNPQRRTHFVLLNLSCHLSSAPGPADFQYFKRSVAYRAIRNLVMHLPRSPLASACQFCFMAVWRTPQGELQSKPMFLSDKLIVSEDETRKHETSRVESMSVGGPV